MRSFLIGLGIGVGLGILFAPMSGVDTRENLSERASDLASSARESFEHGREKIYRGMDQMRSATGRTSQKARTGTEGASHY